MKIECGPSSDRLTMQFELPQEPSKIGVLVSGGIDSAILFYLVNLENILTGNKHTIVPLTIFRKEGSKIFAWPVIEHVSRILNLEFKEPLIVGDNTAFEPTQVTTGMYEAIKLGCKMVFLGVIDTQPQHLIGWTKIHVDDSLLFKFPFKDIKKSHVIDLVKIYKQDALFFITHSCDNEIGKCGVCNGCNEREWGFSQLMLTDPGYV